MNSSKYNIMVEKLQKVIFGHSFYEELPYVEPNEVQAYIESIGGEFDDDLDVIRDEYITTIIFNKKKYRLTGNVNLVTPPVFSVKF